MIHLGDKVHSDHILLRERSGRKRTWVEGSRRISGIYVGWRTYRNGEITWDDYGEAFTITDHIKIALIVIDEKRNPVPVLFEGMELLT